MGVSDWFVAVPAAKAIPLVDKATTAARDARDKWQRRGSKDVAFVSPLIARRALGVTSSRHAPELSVDTTRAGGLTLTHLRGSTDYRLWSTLGAKVGVHTVERQSQNKR